MAETIFEDRMKMIHEFYKRVVDEYFAQRRREHYNWVCCFAEQHNMTDLEFRLFWEVPASIFYKIRKAHKKLRQDLRDGKIVLKWRRYNVIKKAI